MSDCICKRCRARVGRSKLKNGSCIDAEKCMKLIKYNKQPKEDSNNRPINILDSHYFDNYRYNGKRTLRTPNKPRPEETGAEKETN